MDIVICIQEFSPGSNGRMTTMGVYIRDLLLGQVMHKLLILISDLSDCAFIL